jgi:hypothetical protein
MKTIKVTRAQYKALQHLSRRDINTIRKHPQLVGAARDLLKACRKSHRLQATGCRPQAAGPKMQAAKTQAGLGLELVA